MVQVQRNVGRISGPLLHRIDIHIHVPAVKFQLVGDAPLETDDAATILQRVISARDNQLKRLAGEDFLHRGFDSRMIRPCRIDSDSE